MKRVVFLDDLKESDIRSEIVYTKYKSLLSEDIQKYFTDRTTFIDINCPGCLNKNTEFAFKKIEFEFRSCSNCGSIFVSPRPTSDTLRAFCKNSRAGFFFRNTFLENEAEARVKNIFSYRIQWIMGLIEEYLPDAEIFLDYATKYPTLLREVNNVGFFKSLITVLPECFEHENLLPESIKIIRNNNKIKDDIDIFTAFEVVERVFDPVELFNYAYSACKKNGLFLITSTTSSGFEYQILREHSPNIIPVDRLNLLSLEALTSQLEKAGFEIIEVSTPGRLDVEIVKKAYEKNPDIPLDAFWKYLFRYRNESALHSLQEYLQQFQLSSHVRIAAIKR